ncbi:SHOCT domain-containing protein [Nocardioides taihuensis]|uniref:SHOCT domain-containing protein n=1 Tax=Nocardioides taihuensis TaxID=1835606 RepID=A0ABW0BCS3_9ACTN
MIVMMTVFWLGVVVVGVMIFRGQNSNSRSAATSRTRDPSRDRHPLDILDERFARGELDREEYEARKSALQRRDRG